VVLLVVYTFTSIICIWGTLVFVVIMGLFVGYKPNTSLIYIKTHHPVGSKVLVVLWYVKTPVYLVTPIYRGYTTPYPPPVGDKGTFLSRKLTKKL